MAELVKFFNVKNWEVVDESLDVQAFDDGKIHIKSVIGGKPTLIIVVNYQDAYALGHAILNAAMELDPQGK